MPVKSVREMTARERRLHSLETKVFNATLLNCFLVGLVALLIGLGFYTVSLSRQMITDAFNVARSASISISHGVDYSVPVKQVMDIYHSLSEEERASTGTPEYRERFSAVKETAEFGELYQVLTQQLESSDVSDVYIVMYDVETSAMVYVADPDQTPEFECLPGDWESVEIEELDLFLNWDGKSEIYSVYHTERYGWLCTAGVPILAENNKIAAVVLADITLGNVANHAKYFAIQFSISVLVLTAIIAWISTLRMRKTVVTPINEIAEAARNYVTDKREGKDSTDHFSRLNIRTGDEIENLNLVMAEMERNIDMYVDDLRDVTAEKERVGAELDMAAKIQAAMLPHVFPPFPDKKEFDIYATMEPAKEVGGDFYDFFLIDEDHLCLVMADVSGKGVPASLFMMVTKVILQSCGMLGQSASEILNKTNQALCKDNQMEMFVTAWIGILELSTGKLTMCNAGHEYPVFKKPEGTFDLFRDKHGFVLGGFEDETYTSTVLQLEPGTKLFLYTDGVPEAMNAKREAFGLDRMLLALNEEADASPKTLLQNVRTAVSHFVKDAEQFDDITMLCLEYKG